MSEEQVPSGWSTATIETVRIDTEQVKPEHDKEFAYIDISSIDRFRKLITSPQRIYGSDAPSRARKLVKEGDILVALTRPNLNAVAMIPADLDGEIASTGFEVLRPHGIEARWLYYFVRTAEFIEAMSQLVQGALYPAVRGKDVLSTPIPIAPINEQRRITDKLDRVLARVDAANEHLSRVAPLIKRFRQSVLAAAFKGKLTEEFRKQEELTPIDETVKRSPEIPRPNRYNSRTDAVIPGDFALSVNQSNMTAPDGWKWLPMVDVARMESGHTPSRSFPEYWHGNIPWIGIVDARLHHTSTIEDTIQHTNNLGLENSAARLLPEGTVCVSRTASVGYVVKMGKPMATSQDFVNWVCGPAVSPDWLKWLFVAEGAALYRFGKGSTHTTIYFPEWLSLHVALPPLEEQSEIVRRVEKLFAFADRLEERLSQAQAAVQKLTPALLAKAFRGELVPQDPNDEPASELLKRLQESRTDSAKPGRAREPRTKKSH